MRISINLTNNHGVFGLFGVSGYSIKATISDKNPKERGWKKVILKKDRAVIAKKSYELVSSQTRFIEDNNLPNVFWLKIEPTIVKGASTHAF